MVGELESAGAGSVEWFGVEGIKKAAFDELVWFFVVAAGVEGLVEAGGFHDAGGAGGAFDLCFSGAVLVQEWFEIWELVE